MYILYIYRKFGKPGFFILDPSMMNCGNLCHVFAACSFVAPRAAAQELGTRCETATFCQTASWRTTLRLHISLRFHHCPPVLVLQLKRFQYTESSVAQ